MSTKATPVEIIAQVSRIAAAVVDRITGDRADYPLLLAAACARGLERHGIESQIIFGSAAWVEILEDNTVVWAGCWGENKHIWLVTAFRETVDLHTGVAHRKRSHKDEHLRSRYSAPNLWSLDIPRFFRYAPEGVAEIDLTSERDRRWQELVFREIDEKCTPDLLAKSDPEFLDEPLICPERRLIDDTQDSFRHFDRILSVSGIPEAPF